MKRQEKKQTKKQFGPGTLQRDAILKVKCEAKKCISFVMYKDKKCLRVFCFFDCFTFEILSPHFTFCRVTSTTYLEDLNSNTTQAALFPFTAA